MHAVRVVRLTLLLLQLLIITSGVTQADEKRLYFYDSASSPPYMLSRVTSVAQDVVQLNGGGGSQSWTLSPATVAALIVEAQDIPVDLYLRRVGPGSSRDIELILTHSGGVTIGSIRQTLTLSVVPTLYTLIIPNSSLHTVPTGGTLTLTIINQTPSGPAPHLRVYPTYNGDNSRVRLETSTVIDVDSVFGYTAAYPGGTVPLNFAPGDTVFIRAEVSDPFGDFDITGAELELIDPFGTTVVGPTPTTQVSALGVHPRVYEYAYTLPIGGPSGTWTARVTATEGTEGTTVDVETGTFEVQGALLMILKSMVVIDDPSGATTPNAKAIPGANVVYTIRVTNTGPGAVDLDSLVITDPVPADLEFWAADFDGSTSGPVRFDDGSPSSGLTYTFIALSSPADDVDFQGPGPGWGYTPAPVAGYDGAVSAIRINPKGVMSGAGAGNPYFEVRFKARVR